MSEDTWHAARLIPTSGISGPEEQERRVKVNKSDLNVGRSCQHPTDAVRWDEHRALLRCTSCGRKIEDGAELSRRLTQAT